jgi:hypothetical protein
MENDESLSSHLRTKIWTRIPNTNQECSACDSNIRRVDREATNTQAERIMSWDHGNRKGNQTPKRDLRYQRRRLWRLLTSGIWSRIIWYMFTDVSDRCTSSNFMVEARSS